MKNATFSRLAIFGLAAMSSFAFAANSISGMLRLDATFNTEQKDWNDATVTDARRPEDNLYMSRYRVDFKGDIAKSWTYHVRVANDEGVNAQLDLGGIAETAGAEGLPWFSPEGPYLGTTSANAPRFSLAYASWSGIEGMEVALGLIECTNISADNDYYKPYIGRWPSERSVGNIVHTTGHKAGFKADGSFGPIGYSASVWNQTMFREVEGVTRVAADDTWDQGDVASEAAVGLSFDAKSLRLGYAARLTFSPKLGGNGNYGFGMGYSSAPFYMPVVLTTIGVDKTVSSSSVRNATRSAFNQLNQFAIDGAAAFGALQVNAGYESIQLKKDGSALFGDDTSFAATAAEVTASQVLDKNGKATSYWIEAAYLLMGDSYKFDSAQAHVSGVKLRENQAGLELVGRFGQETRKNVMALMTPTGIKDFGAAHLTNTLAIAHVHEANGAKNQYILHIVANNDSTDATQLAAAGHVVNQIVVGTGDDDSAAFQTRSTGFAFGLNYYVNDNACIKAEYESRNNKFMRAGTNATWENSIENYKVSTLRLRAEFSF